MIRFESTRAAGRDDAPMTDCQDVVAIDPRLAEATPPSPVAPRPRTLSGLRVLFFDNGKLHPKLGHYRAIFDTLGQALPARFDGLSFEYRTEQLLTVGIGRLREMAAEIEQSGARAVIFALCDTGVSQATSLLATFLEQREIPTVLVCQGIGIRVAAATADSSVAGIPMVTIASPWAASHEAIAAETMQHLESVVSGLISQELNAGAPVVRRPPTSNHQANADGLLRLGARDPSAEFTSLMAASGLGDGLPLAVPPGDRVEQMVSSMDVSPDMVVWPPVPPRATPVTAREVATLAVMAGCQPRWASVVLTAFRAMTAPEFRLFQAAITTHPAGTLVLVSGPDAGRYAFTGGHGSLGPGF